MIRGEICHEAPVEAPARKVWEAYRGLQLPHLINELLPHQLGTVQVLEGDGSAGTLIQLTFPPDNGLWGPGIGYMKEVFRIMDDEKRVKENEQIEGGYLHLGFHSVVIRFEIIDKHPQNNQTIIRSIIKYEVADDSDVHLVSLISIHPLIALSKAIADHILNGNHTT
ncbi:Norbelladine synthase [Linum grandiflorum]